jgi:hypothetical protein
MIIAAGTLVMVAIVGFVMWARRPAEGSWDDAEVWD